MSAQTQFAPQLRRACRARQARLVAEALVRWLGICFPGLGLLFLAALLLPPTRVASAMMAASALLWVGASLVALFLLPILRPLRLPAYAVWLERRAGLPRNELINALHLEQERRRWANDPISRLLVERSLQAGDRILADLPLRRLHAERRLRPGIARAALGLLPLLIAWAVAPVHFGDTTALFLCAGSERVIPPIEVQVVPGDLRVERGGSVQVQASVFGRRRPGRAQLEMRRPGGEWIRAEMAHQEPAADPQRDDYSFLASALQGDLEYRVRAGWEQSASYRIRVLERLQALGFRKLYEPPAYTKLPPQREVSSSGDLAALSGTRVTLDVRHRRPGAQGRLLFTPPPGRRAPAPHPLRPEGAEVLGAAWEIRESGSYRVQLEDAGEGDFWTSDTFRIEVVPDLTPVVRLLTPPPAIEMPPDMRVTLVADCVDDFGLTELALIYGRPEDEPVRLELAAWDETKEDRVTFNWNLAEIDVLPGQEIHYYLQLLDNDPLHGPKAGETELFSIRFPTMAEMYVAAEQERHGETLTLKDALESQEQLRDELREVAQEMLREKDISWERQQEISDLLERQNEVAEKVEQLQQSLEQSVERMQNQNLFSPEMVEKVREIQTLAQQIQSQEFRELMDRMRTALAKLDRRELQRAMEQMKISQEEISQALDRTLQMMRQLMAEEKIDRLLQKMDELTARQEEINRQLEMGMEPSAEEKQEGAASDSSGAADEMSESGDETPLSDEEAADLAAQQEALRKELEKLQEELAALQQETQQDLEQMSKALEEMMKDPSHQESLEKMKQALEAMQQNQRRQALKFGRKARQALEQMQASMQGLQQDVDLEQQERVARALYEISNRMVKTSMRQEGLMADAQRIGPREMAVYEKELYDEVDWLSDSLLAVAKETPILKRKHLRAMGEILRELERAQSAFETGRRSTGITLATESSFALNAAVKDMLEAANQAQSNCASSCSSPFNKMQSLTGQQSALNQQTRQMMGAMDMPRSQMGQNEAMMRLAARQEMIRQGLEEIREDLEGSGQLMGDLGKTLKEMEDLVRDLKNRKAEQRIIERQERILSRLLNAQRSIRKRDESEERRSRVGVNPELRPGPGAVDMGDVRGESLRRAMLRGSKDPVPSEYRGMVERYMRSLLRENR